MRKIVKIVILLVFLLVLFGILHQSFKNNPRAVLSALIRNGGLTKNPQELIFSVNLFGVVPSAKAVIDKETLIDHNGKIVYFLLARAMSNAFISRFYKAEVVVKSYVDRKTLLPFLFKQDMSLQSKPEKKKEVLYDQKKHVMSIQGQERAILPDTYDPLSALLFIRKSDLRTLGKFDRSEEHTSELQSH